MTVAAFAPAIRPTLLQWDDKANLVDNVRWKGFSWATVKWAFTTFHLGPYQPLSWLSYTLDDAVWRGDARGFYVTNIALQAACGVLLMLVAMRLLPKAVPALAARPAFLAALSAGAALVWSAHPQRVESVAWATERRDVLSGAFLLASLLAWLRHTDADEGGRPWFARGAYWLSFALFACSLLSKATGMGFFLVLVLLDAYPLRRGVSARLAEKVPFLAGGVVIAIVAMLGQAELRAALDVSEVTIPERIVVAGNTFVHHLGATFVPLGLRAHYQRPHLGEFFRWDLLLGMAAFAAVAGIVVLLARRLPALAVTAGVYAVLLGPVSGLTITGSHLFADRYSHQPTMAIGVLVAGWLGGLATRDPPRLLPPAVVAILAGVSLALAAATCALTATWRDTRTLWDRVLAFEPSNWVAHEQLAKMHGDRGEFELAAGHLEKSLASVPDRLVASVFLAYCYQNLGRLDDADRVADHVIANVPTDAPAWRVRARIAAGRGDAEKAVAAWRKSIELSPDYVDALRELGDFLSRQRREGEALEVARRLAALQPRNARTLAFLGERLAVKGDMAEAEDVLLRAIGVDPQDTMARLVLADVYGNTQRMPDAETQLRALLAIDPANVEALERLAIVAAQRGAFVEAAELQVRAADAAPERAETRLRAAGFLNSAGRRDDAIASAKRAAEVARRQGNAVIAGKADQIVRAFEALKNAPK